MNAVGDDLASARQIRLPLFDPIGRAMKRISHERASVGKVSIAPHVDDDRRRFGAEPCIKGIWCNGIFTVVHAQISSTSRVLRSAWTVVSRGDCIFPFASNNLAARQKQEKGLLTTDWVLSPAAIFSK